MMMSVPAGQTNSVPSGHVEQTTIKQLLEAIEAERLRKKRLEWYLREIMGEKEELVREQTKQAAQAPTSEQMGSTPAQVNSMQKALEGYDLNMYTKKRRLSVSSQSGIFPELAPAPAFKRLAVEEAPLELSMSQKSMANFLSLQDEDIQGLVSPTGAETLASASSKAHTSPGTPSSTPSPCSPLTLPPLPTLSDTAATAACASAVVPGPAVSSSVSNGSVPHSLSHPRRPSLSFSSNGSLSFISSDGSFSLNLPVPPGTTAADFQRASNKWSFSMDSLNLGCIDTSHASNSQLDSRASFDWNLWTDDHQLKETLSDFF